MPAPNATEGPVVRPIGDSLFEVTVTRNNRVNLFSEATQRLGDNKAEAELIIKNLEAWAPQLASQSRIRSPDDVFNTPFRVICESDLGHVPFDEEQVIRQYLAVSYCWRPEANAGEMWEVAAPDAASPWPISKPFIEAILAQRGIHTEDQNDRNVNFRREGIWLDQLCIRENDPKEKMQGIAMMDIIYRSCRRLLIVLEDVVFSPEEIEATGRCEIYMKELYEAQISENDQRPRFVPSQADRPHFSSIIGKIEGSRWWSRAWCWHEFETNEIWSNLRSLYYSHGCRMIVRNSTGGTFTLTTMALLVMRPSRWGIESGVGGVLSDEAIKKQIRWTIFTNEASRYNEVIHRGEGAERASILARYYVASACGCTVDSDLISMTINVSGLAISFSGSLRDRNETFFVACCLALAAGEKTPLLLMSTEMVKLNGRDSWLSNTFNEIELNIPKFSLGGIKHIHQLAPAHIVLDLIIFETPVQMATARDLQWTHTYFPDTPIRSRIPQAAAAAAANNNSTNDSRYQQLDGYSDKWRRQFFVNACKNGLQYIYRLWDELERDLVSKFRSASTAEPFVVDDSDHAIARMLLEELSPADPENAHALDVLARFLGFIRWPEARRVVSPYTGRIRCNSAEGVAVVTYPTNRVGSVGAMFGERKRLAIPRDLLGVPWSERRVWLLEPCDDEPGWGELWNRSGLLDSLNGRWRIVGKMMCLGEPNVPDAAGVGDGNQIVSLRTHQMVMG